VLHEVVENRLSVANTRQLIAGAKKASSAERPAPETAGEAEYGQQPADLVEGDSPTARDVVEVLAPESNRPTAHSTGGDIRLEKARRERTRRLRIRLERIASELRNMSVEEVASDLDALPEIIQEARAARVGLDAFIALLERIRLDRAEPEPPAQH
jgi:hypothetical protein